MLGIDVKIFMQRERVENFENFFPDYKHFSFEILHWFNYCMQKFVTYCHKRDKQYFQKKEEVNIFPTKILDVMNEVA